MATEISSYKLGELRIDDDKVLTEQSRQQILAYIAEVLASRVKESELSAKVLAIISANYQDVSDYLDGSADNQYVINGSGAND